MKTIPKIILLISIIFTNQGYNVALAQNSDNNTAILFAKIKTNSPLDCILTDTSGGGNFVNSLLERYKKLNSYTFEYLMTVYQKNQSETESGKMYFKEPKLMRIEQTSGKRNGSVAVLSNNNKVTAHPGGLFKIVKVTLDKYDDDLKCLNGYNMVESDFLSLAYALKSYINKGMKCLVTLKPHLINDLKTNYFILDVYNNNVLYKRVLFDSQNFLPIHWLDYNNGKLYCYSKFYNINTTATINDSVFQP